MRAKLIFEKFTNSNSDPIKDMGIGWNKKTITQHIERLKGTVTEEDIEEFIEELAQEILGGAFEIYLPFNKKEELYFLYKILGKNRIKIKDLDVDDDRIPGYIHDDGYEMEWLYDRIIQPLINRDWEVFHEEENFDTTEYILIKFPA